MEVTPGFQILSKVRICRKDRFDGNAHSKGEEISSISSERDKKNVVMNDDFSPGPKEKEEDDSVLCTIPIRGIKML